MLLGECGLPWWTPGQKFHPTFDTRRMRLGHLPSGRSGVTLELLLVPPVWARPQETLTDLEPDVGVRTGGSAHFSPKGSCSKF